ncbi:unnamed protein product [Echinostoma caproni]|uniref:F-box domain-containing protein n=1 Tax=Echinostoma caproni TaxID=27848 RepID=A0A183AWS2_9TREM|nr:unnamed protein product [Echinostoma caproni]
MLHEFCAIFPELPSDPRTLLSNPRFTPKTTVGDGTYVHSGVSDCIRRVTVSQSRNQGNALQLQLHIGGMSVFRSSMQKVWPILGRLFEPRSTIFIIGLYNEMSKPTDVHAFLSNLIDDLRVLLCDGLLNVESGHIQRVELHSVIADAPAKAVLKQAKQHIGYCCCPNRIQKAVYIKGRLAFRTGVSKARTYWDFRARIHDDHHTGISPFERLPVDMIGVFSTEYVHAVCLGLMKRASMLQVAQNRLVLAIEYVTCKSPRRCRSLNDVELWKATEYRQFLLYLGPVILRHILPLEMYENFLEVSVFTFIFRSGKFATHYLPYVEQQSLRVVRDFAHLRFREDALG